METFDILEESCLVLFDSVSYYSNLTFDMQLNNQDFPVYQYSYVYLFFPQASFQDTKKKKPDENYVGQLKAPNFLSQR